MFLFQNQNTDVTLNSLFCYKVFLRMTGYKQNITAAVRMCRNMKRRRGLSAPPYCALVAHTGNDNDDDEYPKDHIKIEVAASAAASAVAVAHIIHFSVPPFAEDSI